MYLVQNFIKRCVCSVVLCFWIESVCLSSVGKEFHIVGAAKKMSDGHMFMSAA